MPCIGILELFSQSINLIEYKRMYGIGNVVVL